MTRRVFVSTVAVLGSALTIAHARGQTTRALGIDVSDWQNQTGTGLPIDWARVARPVSQGGGGKQFAFIRSSRGGTAGTYDEHTREGTLSHRYDDFAFVYNITNAKANGVLAGPYHFGRADILSYQVGTNTVIHTGTDEANHMLQQAGAYMKPGYLRPVFDLEAGNTQRTRAELTNFALDFANRIYDAKGVYPLVYINSSYANDEVDARATVMDMWIARWPNQANPDQINLNGDPPAASSYPNVYGVWNPAYPQIPNPTPWKFWQYASTGHVPGIGNGTTDPVDLDVAHGDVEYVKQFLMPAAWVANASGQWTTAANWNANPDLPGPDDRVIIDRPAGDFLITLGAGSHSVRSVQSSERFMMDGGSLAVQQYVNFNNAATIAGGQLTSGSLMNNAALTQTDGTVISGPVTGSGSITVTGGQLTARSIRQPSLTFGGTGTVRIEDEAVATRVGALNGSGAGRFDLTDSAVVIDYSGPSPLLLVRTLINSGYDNGSWDGPGIVTSAGPGYAVGYGETSELPGVPLIFRPADATSILLRGTRYGDANLDGVVNLDDFNQLATNFGTGDTWHEGDFNYDGVVTLSDFNLLAANFGFAATGPDVSSADWAALASAAPEPAAPVALLTVALAMRLRQRPPARIG